MKIYELSRRIGQSGWRNELRNRRQTLYEVLREIIFV